MSEPTDVGISALFDTRAGQIAKSNPILVLCVQLDRSSSRPSTLNGNLSHPARSKASRRRKDGEIQRRLRSHASAIANSVGRWEGDTLIVTTAGYNDRTTIDLAGHPHTEALRMTERYRRRDAGHLDVQITFDDPKAYTRPWTLPMEFALVPDGDLIGYVCENERDASHLVGKSGEEFPISANRLAQYAGAYQMSTRPVAIVSLDDGRLMVAEGQSGKIPLVAHSETFFTMEGTGVEFLKDEKGAVTAMIEHWVEGDRKYSRLDLR